MGGEEGLLSMALNVHVDAKGPEGWHFLAKRSTISVFDDRILRSTAVRLQRQLDWVGTPLLDLVKNGLFKLSKPLPLPELSIITKDQMAEYSELKAYCKRQRARAADEQFDPNTMADDLWKRLGVSIVSLPSYLRPGAHAR